MYFQCEGNSYLQHDTLNQPLLIFQKQVNSVNKVVNHVLDILNQAKEDWETEANSRTQLPQTFSNTDTQSLVAAIGLGKNLRPNRPANGSSNPPSNQVPQGLPSNQNTNMGPTPSAGKAPSSIKTNIKSASGHPYSR